MAIGTTGASSRIWLIVGVLGVVGLALFMGWAVGVGITGLPIYALVILILLTLMMINPATGPFAFLAAVHILPFLPPSITSPGYTTEVYVFGLSATNALLLMLAGSWFMRFAVAQRVTLPMGPVGKVVLIFLAFMTVSMIRSVLIRTYFPAPAIRETALNYVAYWRAGVIAPLFALLIMQTHINKRHFMLILKLYAIVMIMGVLAGVEIVADTSGESMLTAHLRGAPLNLGILMIPFYGIAVTMILLDSRMIHRLFWLALMLLATIPVGYLHRRGTYVAILAEVIIVFIYLIKDRKSNKMMVAFLFLVIVAVGVFFMPETIIERVQYTFYDPSSGVERFDPSVGVRFLLWGVAVKKILETWWIALVGLGFARAPSVTREALGSGLSIHNTYLQEFLDHGIPGIALMIACYVVLFRMFRLMRNAPEPLAAAFGNALMAFTISIQLWNIAHSTSVSEGQHGMMLWVIAALVTTQLHPGGMFADMRLPDGRLGKELLGYPPGAAEHTNQSADLQAQKPANH